MIDRSHQPTLAVILAGGSGSRFGGDKPLTARLAGRPVIQHVLDRLEAMDLPVAINTNSDPALFASFGHPVFDDGQGGREGPLAGLLAALDRAEAGGYRSVLTVPADTPFLPPDLFERLAEAEGPAVAASGSRLQPVVGLWPISVRGPLRAAFAGEGLRRVVTFAERIGARKVSWAVDPHDPFFDIDTVADLLAAEEMLQQPKDPAR